MKQFLARLVVHDYVHQFIKGNNEKLIIGNKIFCKNLGQNYKYLQVEDYKLHSRLTIFDIEKEDFGMYKCVSKNSLGETESTLRLYGRQNKDDSISRHFLNTYISRPATKNSRHICTVREKKIYITFRQLTKFLCCVEVTSPILTTTLSYYDPHLPTVGEQCFTFPNIDFLVLCCMYRGQHLLNYLLLYLGGQESVDYPFDQQQMTRRTTRRVKTRPPRHTSPAPFPTQG